MFLTTYLLQIQQG